MRIIDLLNKIANKEEVPKKIKVLSNVFEYDEYNYIYINVDETHASLLRYLGFYKGTTLNEEIEIIEDTPKEDKKIEKFKVVKDNTNNLVKLVIDKETKLTISIVEAIILDKVNEIIDRLNGDSNDN